jgi:hypothetical protein
MRNIILMMPVSADGYTLIIGTPAGRPCGHPGTGRADYGRGRRTRRTRKDPPFGAQHTPATAWRKLTQRDSRRVGFTADAGQGGSRRPPARRPERRHASSWSH